MNRNVDENNLNIKAVQGYDKPNNSAFLIPPLQLCQLFYSDNYVGFPFRITADRRPESRRTGGRSAAGGFGALGLGGPRAAWGVLPVKASGTGSPSLSRNPVMDDMRDARGKSCT